MIKLRTSLNYVRRSRCFCLNKDRVVVAEIDTSVDSAVKNSNIDMSSGNKGTYLDSEEPVNYYSQSVLMTNYDPLLTKQQRRAAAAAEHAQNDNTAASVQQNVATQNNAVVQPQIE